MAFKGIGIQVSDHSIGSVARFGLCIHYSLHHIFKIHGILVMLLHLNLDGRFETFPEVADHG